MHTDRGRMLGQRNRMDIIRFLPAIATFHLSLFLSRVKGARGTGEWRDVCQRFVSSPGEKLAVPVGKPAGEFANKSPAARCCCKFLHVWIAPILSLVCHRCCCTVYVHRLGLATWREKYSPTVICSDLASENRPCEPSLNVAGIKKFKFTPQK